MIRLREMLSREKSDKGFVCELLVLSLAAILFLANLGNGYLWQDEAQTALIARTILHGGLPLGYDGLNSFSQELGADYGAGYLWKWHPWFPFYLLALFFSVDVSTFTARLPFALIGIATVVLVYFFVRENWHNRRLALLAALLLTVSVPFLILSRQCKYLSLTAFLSVLALYGYARITSGRKHGVTVATLAVILLFNTQFVYCVPLAATMAIHAFLFHRKSLGKIVLVYVVAGVLDIPGIFWFGGTAYGGGHKAARSALQYFGVAYYYAGQLFRHLMPTILVVPFACLWVYGSRRSKRFLALDRTELEQIALPTLFIATCLAVLVVASPAAFFRYLSPLVPMTCILLALLAEAALLRSLLLGTLLVCFLVLSNPLPDYLYELTHAYNGPVEGIVSYLNGHAKKGDLVAITYGDLPLKFYTPLRVLGGLTGENLAAARNADWVIIRKHTICEKDQAVRDYLLANIDPAAYRAIQINSPDLPFENRESPDEHLFRTFQQEDPVVIYQKTP